MDHLEESRTMTLAGELRELLKLRLLQLAALIALMTGVGTTSFVFKYSVLDLDIWWHLKVGDWIVDHRAVPHTGIFSHTAANRAWTAYSWGYEVLLSRAYAWFGLMGIGWFGVLLTIAVAAALFCMLYRLCGRFWRAWLLSIIACTSFLFNIMPRPVFFSITLFAITLMLILQAQRSSEIRLLYWLPLIFLLWANLHIQFIYGLFLIGLFVAVNILQRILEWLRRTPDFLLKPSLPLSPLLLVLVTSMVASWIGPYSFRLYQVVFEYSKAKVPYAMIIELQALSFTSTTHFVVVLLAAAAFFVVGWQQKLDPFKLSLLAIATIVAFRTQRDAWFICVPAAACLADLPRRASERERPFRLRELVGAAAAAVLALLLIAQTTQFNTRGLDRAISRQFPVDAVNFLRKNPLPGPMYNSFDWGGFLMWYMPQYAVAIDGRNDLYGDEMDALSYKTEGGDPSYAQDPYLNEARFVLLKADVPLAGVLTLDARFRPVYKDAVAVVFVHQ
jgi:hypothetical protein